MLIYLSIFTGTNATGQLALFIPSLTAIEYVAWTEKVPTWTPPTTFSGALGYNADPGHSAFDSRFDVALPVINAVLTLYPYRMI